MRDKFSVTEMIPVSEIMLDQENFRLGQAESQTDCIAMMFKEFGEKMVKIAAHIAAEGLSPRPIVIAKNQRGLWVVKDGNRRVTALKLLNNPALAPEKYKATFISLNEQGAKKGTIPQSVSCLFSDDQDAIIKYMQLEHLGPQDGVGQVDWGPREKDNMYIALGEKPRDAIARAVCDYLSAHGLAEAKTVKITNIQRLLQDSNVQNEIGITWDGATLGFSLNEAEVRQVLTEIILDFANRGKKVDDIYHSTDRESYVNELFSSRGIKRPTKNAALVSSGGSSISTPISPANNPTSPDTGTPISTPTRPPRVRARLIPPRQGLRVPSTQAKVVTIVYELAKKIDVRDAPISASVLLRLLIEYSVDNYCKINAVSSPEKLHKKISAAALHMESNGSISKKQRQQLDKMCNHDELFSAHTLNQYVHNASYTPSGSDLCTFWDNIYFFLSNCW